MAKQQPDIVIDRLGTHLFRITRKDGTQSFKWDWNKLEEEVKAATTGKIKGVSANPLKGRREVVKKDLVQETEAKVTKSRAKKATVTDQITDSVTAKKPAAKTPAAKKKSTTKKSTK